MVALNKLVRALLARCDCISMSSLPRLIMLHMIYPMELGVQSTLFYPGWWPEVHFSLSAEPLINIKWGH